MKRIVTYMILMLACGFAQAQTNAVFSDGTDLYSQGGTSALQVIASDFVGNSFRPAFASFQIASEPYVTAISSVVTNGTITAGSVTNTWVEDSSYYTVQETGQFEIYFTFSNSATSTPEEMTFRGRYEGDPAHDVVVEAYDYIDTAWESMTGDAGDIQSGSTDTTYKWMFQSPKTNFINASGFTQFRFRHDSSSVASHYIYMDYLALTYATVAGMTGGTWYDFGNVHMDASQNVTTDSTNATITTIDAGCYRTGWYASFTGSTNTIFTIRHLTNSVATGTEMWRSIGSSSAIGSASAFGYETQDAGTTNSWQIRADRDDAWFTIVNGHNEVNKVSN